MAKGKKTKFEQAAHIKEHTVGTSNELSFSVLDAAKKAADGDSSTGERSRPGFLQIFSFPVKKTRGTPTKDDVLPLSGDGATSMPTDVSSKKAPSKPLSFEEPTVEIARRKAKRRNYNRLVVAFVLVISLTVVGGVGYFAYSEISNHSAQVSTLDQALNLVISADETIIAIDEVLSKPVTDETIEQADTLATQIARARQDLGQAKAATQQANTNLRDSADKEAATQAIAAIEAREEMLTLGSALMQADIAAKQGVDALVEAWGLILQADTFARDAATLVADTTPENVAASMQSTSQALEALNKANSLIDQVSATYPDIDVAAQKQYVAKKIEASQEALASDEAILVQDRQTAEAHNNAYNQADKEAVELAKSLPENPAQPVLDRYANDTAETKDNYQHARARAGMADAFLRDYLGTSNK